MFISKEEFSSRLSHEHNLVKRMNVEKEACVLTEINNKEIPKFDETHFNANGIARNIVKLDDDKRVALAVTAALTSPKIAAEIFDTSPTTAINPPERLRSRIFDELARVRTVAREKLELSLSKINEESLEAIEKKNLAKNAADIAQKLSSIIEKTIEKVPDQTKESHLHLYSPIQRTLEDFTTKVITAVPVENFGNKDASSSD